MAMFSPLLYAANLDAQVGCFWSSLGIHMPGHPLAQTLNRSLHIPVLNCLPGILLSVSFGSKFLATEVIASYSTTLTLHVTYPFHSYRLSQLHYLDFVYHIWICLHIKFVYYPLSYNRYVAFSRLLVLSVQMQVSSCVSCDLYMVFVVRVCWVS